MALDASAIGNIGGKTILLHVMRRQVLPSAPLLNTKMKMVAVMIVTIFVHHVSGLKDINALAASKVAT